MWFVSVVWRAKYHSQTKRAKLQGIRNVKSFKNYRIHEIKEYSCSNRVNENSHGKFCMIASRIRAEHFSWGHCKFFSKTNFHPNIGLRQGCGAHTSDHTPHTWHVIRNWRRKDSAADPSARIVFNRSGGANDDQQGSIWPDFATNCNRIISNGACCPISEIIDKLE